MNIEKDFDVKIENEKIKSDFKRRMESRFPFESVRDIVKNDSIIVAGGCFLKKTPNDYDLYPDNGGYNFNNETKATLLTKTANAKTYKSKEILQFCNYNKPSIDELIESFDFAHCQIAAVVDLKNDLIRDITFTDAFIQSQVMETTWFTGSEYPLSSLIRINKYIKRGRFSGKSWIWETFKVLTAIIERGVKDYDDFKDQLDAVDLGLLPEEIKDGDFDGLMSLFEALGGKRNDKS